MKRIILILLLFTACNQDKPVKNNSDTTGGYLMRYYCDTIRIHDTVIIKDMDKVGKALPVIGYKINHKIYYIYRNQ